MQNINLEQAREISKEQGFNVQLTYHESFNEHYDIIEDVNNMYFDDEDVLNMVLDIPEEIKKRVYFKAYDSELLSEAYLDIVRDTIRELCKERGC